MDTKADTKPDDAITQMAAPVVPPASGEALHVGENDLPFVDLGDGTKIQLQQVDLTQGLWVLRTKFSPGYQVATHYHTGPVFAVTFTGSWHYREYPDVVNTKGSYLFEPAGSVHTLIVPDTNTEGSISPVFPQRNASFLGQIGQSRHCAFFDDDEPPGFQLAMIGAASGCGQQRDQFVAGRRRGHQRLGGP